MKLAVSIFMVNAATNIAKKGQHGFEVEARTRDECVRLARDRLDRAGAKIRSVNTTAAGLTVYVEVVK